MLIEAAAVLGLKIKVFLDSKDCPATHCAIPSSFEYEKVVGTYTLESLRGFLSSCETVIFESEFIDTNLLQKAADGLSISFLPALPVMARFQDKLEQKKICKDYDLPTAKWIEVDSNAVESSLQAIITQFNGKAVFKWSRLGYDGKGNFFLKDITLQRVDLLSFIEKGIKGGAVIYAEEVVPYVRELAIVCCRAVSGEMIEYPVVISEQQNGICLNVKGPANSFGVSDKITNSLKSIAHTIGEKGSIVGTYAVEAFEVANGVLVNEIAPRVHNTGHYSQDGCKTSQFENHMRAISGMPLSLPDSAPFIGMRNILGPSSITRDSVVPPSGDAECFVHWYHKQGTRAGRKLGHINFSATTSEKLSQLIESALTIEKNWIESL